MPRRPGRRALLSGVPLLAMPPRPGRAGDAVPDVAWRRAVGLQAGVNLSRWRNPLDPAAAEGDGPADLAAIAGLGSRHVRLPVDPGAVLASGDDATAARLAAGIARDVDIILRHGLAVIVDLHPDDAVRARLATDPAEVARLARLWARIAGHLAGTDPERVVLEPLNEPGEAIGAAWPALQARLVAVIRAAAPRHSILATGGLWSTIGDLVALAPLDDRNLIYGFDFYAPMIFSHQGADWAGVPYAGLRGVPYPLRLADIARLAAAAAPEDRPRIAQEGDAGRDCDRTGMAVVIAEAGDWSRRHGVPVICTEFGAYRDGGATPADRQRYLSDVRDALGRYAQAWTQWNYSGGFGVGQRARRGPAGSARHASSAVGDHSRPGELGIRHGEIHLRTIFYLKMHFKRQSSRSERLQLERFSQLSVMC